MSSETKHSPPKLGQWILKKVCPSYVYEDVEGDLEELYQKRIEEGKGKIAADLQYIYEALATSRLRSIQLRRQINENYKKDHFAMFTNYFKIAVRSIQKHKGYHFLNIGGLAVGLAAFLMIALFVHYELSYDTWMSDSDQIYRIPMEIGSEGNSRKFSLVSGTVAPSLKNDYSQVEEALRLWKRGTRLVELETGQKFYEENVYYADSTFFQFFDLEMINGNEELALTRPNTIVLSEETAIRYFGNIGEAIGKTIKLNASEFEVTGVMQNTPGNTHHSFNMVGSWTTLGSWPALDNWHLTMFSTYVKLNDGTDTQAFAQEISSLANNYVADEIAQNGQEYVYYLQPVKDIHLLSDFGFEAKPTGSITTVYVFSVIGILILFIAGLNFINLSTARSEMRAKEVGMRKVIGANRSSLVGQFLGEAFVLSMLSLVLAMVVFYLAFPWYNELVGLPYDASIILNPLVTGSMIALAAGSGLLAGFYPAIVLSSFNPLSMFKSRGGTQNRGALLRKVLVVGQFAVSVILIVSTITVFKQLNHMMVKDLGFNKEQMLVLPVRGSFDIETQYQPVKDVFGNMVSVEGVTLSSSVPGQGVDNFATWLPREDNNMMQSMYYLFVEYDFAKTYGLDIIEGRDFDASYSTDLEQAFLINEEAVKSLGWSSPEEAIGERIQSGAGGFIGEVVGVFKNFHYQSVDQVVDPLVLNIRDRVGAITLRIQADNIPETIEEVEAAWTSIFPDKPFEYEFLDESFNAQYNSFTRLGNIVLTFSILAILIACLGLYGLAAFSAERRIREIGIRKVFGATVSSLTTTVSLDFLKLVLISTVIGLPAAWWLITTWLNQFAYKIQPDVSMFLISGAIAFMIAIVTVSHQSIKAALANPTDSLRSE